LAFFVVIYVAHVDVNYVLMNKAIMCLAAFNLRSLTIEKQMVNCDSVRTGNPTNS